MRKHDFGRGCLIGGLLENNSQHWPMSTHTAALQMIVPAQALDGYVGGGRGGD